MTEPEYRQDAEGNLWLGNLHHHGNKPHRWMMIASDNPLNLGIELGFAEVTRQFGQLKLVALTGWALTDSSCNNQFSSQNLTVTCQREKHPASESCRFEWTQDEEDPHKNRHDRYELDLELDDAYTDYPELADYWPGE